MNQNIIKIIGSSSIEPRHLFCTTLLNLLPLKQFSFLECCNTVKIKALHMVQTIAMKLISSVRVH